MMNKKIDQIIDKSLEQKGASSFQYFAWVPTIDNLRFTFFNPNYYAPTCIHQCHHAQFPSLKDSAKTPLNRFLSFSCINLSDNKNIEKGGFNGIHRVYFYAEETADKESIKGELIFSSADRHVGSKKEKERLKKTGELSLIEHNLNLEKLNKCREQAIENCDNYDSIYKKIKKLNEQWPKVKKTFSTLKKSATSITQEKDNPKVLFSYEFQLFRNGFLFFKEASNNNLFLEEKPFEIPDYLYTTRDKKMMYYYVKQSFHTDAFHPNKIDSMIGVCNLRRLKVKKTTKKDALKDVLYKHQKGYLIKAILTIKKKKNLGSCDPRGIAAYLEAYRQKCYAIFLMSKSDDDYWAQEERSLKNLKASSELWVKEECLSKSVFISNNKTAYFFYVLPILVFANILFSANKDLFCLDLNARIIYYSCFFLFAIILKVLIFRGLEKRVLNRSSNQDKTAFLSKLLKKSSSLNLSAWIKEDKDFPAHIQARCWWTNKTAKWKWTVIKALCFAVYLFVFISLAFIFYS